MAVNHGKGPHVPVNEIVMTVYNGEGLHGPVNEIVMPGDHGAGPHDPGTRSSWRGGQAGGQGQEPPGKRRHICANVLMPSLDISCFYNFSSIVSFIKKKVFNPPPPSKLCVCVCLPLNLHSFGQTFSGIMCTHRSPFSIHI